MIYYEVNGEYKPITTVEKLDVSVCEERLISHEPIVLEGTIEGDIRKLIPLGYRNAENLRRDGYLNSSNAEWE